MKKKITLSKDQKAALKHIKEGRNVLITGSAGTGKSTLLRELSKTYLDLPIVASTGIAAVNVQGTTLHSWAGLGKGDGSAEEIFKKLKERSGQALGRVKRAQRLAVDEVSMLHGDLFETTDKLFRMIRQNDAPFGGVQLILFGDFLQLPPVSRGKPQRFAFQSESWRQADIKTRLLTQVFRQEDQVFSSALNHIRLGNLTPEVHSLLKSRLNVADPSPQTEPVTVYTHNDDVDRMNEARLEKIRSPLKEWRARDNGQKGAADSLKHCKFPEVLKLKKGAQVMCLWNIAPEDGIANGSIGTVVDFAHETGLPIVRYQNGLEEEMERKTWEIKVGNEVVATRTQIPLRLAWAITAHKSQGMTLDKIRVHLDKAFEYGQSYVALSRARTLEGLFIESSKFGCIKAHPDAVEFYQNAS